ncbi:MAG: UDP-N-acetylmuramate:L-alanyl-gamma-D-glutamyl-meso-diaminopimelate ligase [Pseudomonadota bacterium]
MKVHIIGVCGTFMGGVAKIATELGFEVSGSDANTYPPMSTALESLGIKLFEGYAKDNIPQDLGIVVVGNTVSRGNPELEEVLNQGVPYSSGAQWLKENVLQHKWVLAVAGTHGKTTTSSMLAWILEYCGYEPGFLIGGIPANFAESARLGNSDFFVIEADEYDTAFSDKRSKFLHYSPNTVVLNNLEFDHADIFNSIDDIKLQFHHLLKILPQSAQVICKYDEPYLQDVIALGCWSEQKTFGADAGQDWYCESKSEDCSTFQVTSKVPKLDTVIVEWDLIGNFNMLNGTAAMAAAHHIGITPANSAEALSQFKSVKRRLEVIFSSDKVTVYDDFAHHPTAIAATVKALRAKVGGEQIFAVLEPRSNTMKQGVHKHLIAESLATADHSFIFADANVDWNIAELSSDTLSTFDSTQLLLDTLLDHQASTGKASHILIMSNGGFEGLHQRLITALT